MFTDNDLRDQVRASVSGVENEFDVTAIVDEIQERYGTVDIGTISSEVYWAIVAKHDRGKA